MTTIRPATMADLDGLTALLQILFAIEADFACDEARQRRGLAMLLASDTACVLVAEAEGRVVGMVTGQLTISTAEGGFALLVEDVVVADGWRGQGIGRELLAALAGWAGTQGIGRLQLLADRNNGAALEFYRKLGWHSTELICQRKRIEPIAPY
ncbi:MAG: GNAT family N-acetyltransferase [Thermodesulfobacteriota bacterium]|jgi:ribosomal protein S18 acetylase RimI-like enzyme